MFFFDPGKPGTTGEAVSSFTETLSGLEYKLLIVMNKVDLFTNIRDFARTYGTLCWNLARLIKTKDVPHIFNTYLPNKVSIPKEGDRGDVQLHDFDIAREEVISQIKRTPSRRADNLVSDLYNHGRRLAMHCRVCTEAAQQYKSLRNRLWTLLGILGLATIVLTSWFRQAESLFTPVSIFVAGLAVSVGVWYIAQFLLQRFRDQLASSEKVDLLFEKVFYPELSMNHRADLRAIWDSIRRRTIHALKLRRVGKLPASYATRRAVQQLTQVIEKEVPQMRRNIADYHRHLQSIREGEDRPAPQQPKPSPTPRHGHGRTTTSRAT